MTRTSQECTTTEAAFVRYGVASTTDLATATYFRLATTGHDESEASSAFVDALADAFRTAFVRRADLPIVPEPVEAAIADAVGPTAHALLDHPDADLHGDVTPAFAARVARYTCAYLSMFPEGGQGIERRD